MTALEVMQLAVVMQERLVVITLEVVVLVMNKRLVQTTVEVMGLTVRVLVMMKKRLVAIVVEMPLTLKKMKNHGVHLFSV